ncbi:MAG: ATP-binding cassette domain-containing protein [Thermoplasmata archaeon]|nr:ATP-binding cassette domain-containing protein [Thermoplasmata archaeon]
MTSEKPIVRVEHLHKDYPYGEKVTRALNDVSFEIERGEFVVILGQSGSGKTTLLNMISALDVPTKGKVLVGGRQVSSLLDRERERISGPTKSASFSSSSTSSRPSRRGRTWR